MIENAARPEINSTNSALLPFPGLCCHLILFTIIWSIHDLHHTSFHMLKTVAKWCLQTSAISRSVLLQFWTLCIPYTFMLGFTRVALSSQRHAVICITGIENGNKVSLQLRTEKSSCCCLLFWHKTLSYQHHGTKQNHDSLWENLPPSVKVPQKDKLILFIPG